VLISVIFFCQFWLLEMFLFYTVCIHFCCFIL